MEKLEKAKVKKPETEFETLFEDLDSMIADDADDRNRKCITIWVSEAYYEKYAFIQGKTKKKFAKFMRKAVSSLIDRAENKLLAG